MVCAQTAEAVFHPLHVKNGKFFKTFFDIVTTHNDELSNVKHALDPVCVFFTLFGCWGGGGGGPNGAGQTQPAYAVFHPRQLKNGNFHNCFFFVLQPSKMNEYPV